MKIILTGLGMKGEITDWPENSSPRIKLVLSQPLSVLKRYEDMPDTPPMNTICEFEWIGKIDYDSGARIYSLSDIYKG